MIEPQRDNQNPLRRTGPGAIHKPGRLIFIGLLTSSAILLGGCASVSLDEDPKSQRARGSAPIVSAANPGAEGTRPPEPAPEKRVAGFSAAELSAAGFNAEGKASIFFDFDSTNIRQQDLPIIDQTARLMKQSSQARLLVEGHTDARGTSEYNLALGQKRADAIRTALGLLGVAEAQVDAVSHGEEYPRSTDQSEEGFAVNRRADLSLQ